MYTRNPASPARPTRRSVLALAAAPLLAGMAGGALAETGWPSKMLRLVVPFPAGGPTDTASRIVGQKLGERLKQTVVVENRPGASGSIAAVQVAKSPADGYTLMMLATPTLLAPHLYKKAGYDTVKDFTPVATVYDLPIVIVVNPTLLPDVTDLKSLIAHAKAQKVALNYTSSGAGRAAPHPGRQAARHRRGIAPARGHAARHQDHCRAGHQGLRRRLLGRPAGAQGHA